MIGYSVDSSVVMQNKKYHMLEFLTLISIDCFLKGEPIRTQMCCSQYWCRSRYLQRVIVPSGKLMVYNQLRLLNF